MKVQLLVPYVDGQGVQHGVGDEIDVATSTYVEQVAARRLHDNGVISWPQNPVFDDVAEHTAAEGEVEYTAPDVPDASPEGDQKADPKKP